MNGNMSDVIDKLILTSEAQLRYVIREYLEYYNHERPHSGLGGKMIDPRPPPKTGKIVRRSRLDGLLNTYVRVAVSICKLESHHLQA